MTHLYSLIIYHHQFPFQAPPIGGTDSISKAYFSGRCKGIYPQTIALLYGTVPGF